MRPQTKNRPKQDDPLDLALARALRACLDPAERAWLRAMRRGERASGPAPAADKPGRAIP
jgi:hypothetical protein